MKVLFISPYPPDPAPEANHALHLSEQLAKLGHTVHVLSKKGSIPATHQDIVVHPVIEDWSWSDLPRLTKSIRGCRPDVVLLLYIGWVYNHHPMITYLPTICKTILPGVPCVTQFEIVDTESPRQSFGARALRKVMALWAGGKDVHWSFGTLLRDSARTIVLSSPHRDRLVKQYSEVEEKTVVIPPPPLIRQCADGSGTVRQQVRNAIGAVESDFVLIYWGYIYQGKGVETLLEAFQIACRRNNNLRLLLVGGSLEIPNQNNSAYLETARRLAETLGIADRVTWTGRFDWDSDEGSRYLYAGDACVLPFDYGVTLNNSSLAAASTHGVPVIGTELRVGRDEALEHGRNIFLCRPRDPKMLADAIQMISKNAEFRDRLRSGIRKLAHEWHRWDAMTARMVEILESAVSRHRAPGHNEAAELPQAQARSDHDSSLIRSDHNATAPPVSVIVAAYNVEKYLSQCLDSLANQTLKNIEIIVVDDASTDNSAGIINEYKARYPNFRTIHCGCNRGLATVRNLGMGAARGQYIAFTDADDWADIRMCEVMYRRASEDNADVLITDPTVYYDNSKTFGQLFDQHIRQTLDPRLRTMPFDLRREPRVLLLEPVAWPKLYKRSFLQKHGIQFEDGMNSYEDICFHFSVLVKAARISLLDESLLFYRMNRPGQISARTSRKIFEVFAVFQRIHENLSAWNVSADIWAMLVRVQLRQFDWLLKDRVQAAHKREFLALVARQFAVIPEPGLRGFTRQASPDELSRLLCMRKNWLYIYERVTRQRWRLFTMLYAAPHDGRSDLLKGMVRRGWGMLRQQVISFVRSLINKSFQLEEVENTFRIVNDRLNQLTNMQALALQSGEPLVEPCRINSQTLFLSRSANSGLGHAIQRMQNDYYLTQTAVFREADTVIDVGAHVGVVSIYLAKKFPSIKVYAIEPDPLNYACLKRNIEINGVKNVIAINKAVSGDGRKRTLYVDAGESAWATINPGMADSHGVLRTAPVNTITLEQLFQEHGIQHCRLLKITAPGAIDESLEAFARRGCVDLICGEVYFADCNRVKLEIASWRIARQHFWRTVDSRAHGTACSWIHQLPAGIEQFPSDTSSSVSIQATA